MSTVSAAATIDLLVDPGTFRPWEPDVFTNDPLDFVDSRRYADRLADARTKTGSDESVRAGGARIGGIRVAVMACEYGFIGGSIGAATGELITRAFERAEAARLPLIAVTRSGGTRMQEGNYGFTQIVKTLAAVERFRRSGLPYFVYLGHPTVGGVLASWGSRGHVTFAEPGALIGFAGPRGAAAMTGTTLPEGVQSAENLAAHGLVDEVVCLAGLRQRLLPLLRVVDPDRAIEPRRASPSRRPSTVSDMDSWESVLNSRDPQRPGAHELIRALATDITYLHGDGQGGPDDPAMAVAVCALDGMPAIVVAQQRSVPAGDAAPSVGGYRKARRGIALASDLGLPIVTIVDTSGAGLSVPNEQGGLAHQLAGCLADLLATPSPVLSVLLGQGSGGGALAVLAGDAVLAAERAWLAPIAPEAASAILYGGADRACSVARAQKVGASGLTEVGIVDEIVPDPAGDAGLGPLADAVSTRLRALRGVPSQQRLALRQERYRNIGNGAVRAVAAATGEEGGRNRGRSA